MKRSINSSKAVALFLAFAVVLSSLFAVPATAKAADSDNESSVIILLNESGTAVANNAVNYAFNISASTYAAIQIVVPAPVGMNIQVTRTADSYLAYSDTITSAASDWDYEPNGNYYFYMITWNTPTTGDYNLSLTFDADTSFMAFGALNKPAASISNSSIILTKGFSQKLSVSNATVSKWSSSNTKVAAVDANGKVTAKATGSATITATATTGETVTCSVKVKANAYTKAKMSFSSARYGNAYISVTKVSYNNKGDLVIKASFLNNCGHKIIKIKNLKINVKNKSGKIIGTYNAKTQNVTILQGGQKSFTYTIKKAKLKQKTKQDLRQASIKPSWKYTYRY